MKSSRYRIENNIDEYNQAQAVFVKCFAKQDYFKRLEFEKETSICRLIQYNDTSYFIGTKETLTDYELHVQFIEGHNWASKFLSNENSIVHLSTFWPFYYKLLQAADDLHQCGIIHNDIKPQNIMITSDDQVKLIDFSNSQLLSERLATNDVTNNFTPAFASPENFFRKKLSIQSDLYQLGVVLLISLSKRSLIDDYYASAINKEFLIHNLEVPELAETQLSCFREIISKAIAFHRKDRWENLEQFKTAITNCINLKK